MPKQHPIRWRESDLKEVERVVRNFNNKIYRLRKKADMGTFLPIMKAQLPDTVRVADFVEGIGTRQQLNRELKKLQRFSRRGSEEIITSSRGGKTLKWYVEEAKEATRILNIQKAHQRKALQEKDIKSRGSKTGTKVADFTSKQVELRPTKVNFENLSQKEWDLKRRWIDRQIDPLFQEQKKYSMRANYIKGLENMGFSPDIVEIVRNLPIDKFVEIVQTDTEGEFTFIYDPLEFEAKEGALKEVWGSSAQEEFVGTLKKAKYPNKFIKGVQNLTEDEFMTLMNAQTSGRFDNLSDVEFYQANKNEIIADWGTWL